MVKTYYRNEYTEKQWKALIDEATELGCQVTYGRYGDRAEIDSTVLEDDLCKKYPKAISTARQRWVKIIHDMLQESTDLRTWKVRPKRYHRGYCSTICKSQKSAEFEQEHLERITGFEWEIIVIPE